MQTLNLNLTTPRKAVLDVVQRSTDHPTATDIMDILSKQGHRFAYATIYNSLRYLTDHGLIRELNLGNGIMRYDGRMEEHHHVICQKCGAVSEAATDIPESLLKQIEAETGYRIHELNMQFVGVCPKCRSGQPQ